MKYEYIDNCINERLAQSIIDEDHRLMLAKGTVITRRYVEKLKDYDVYLLAIEDENEDIVLHPVVAPDLVVTMERAVNTIDVDRTSFVAEKLVKSLVENEDNLVEGFVSLREYDENTALHSINVAILSVMLGINLALDTAHLNYLAFGALLHDIGKSKISLDILNKPGRLTEEEMKIVKKHPKEGYDMIKEDILMPAPVKAIVLQHHENWDGSGYPFGLKGEDIYDLASIVHICDVFDALISERIYKSSFSYKKALNFLKSNKGVMFNPEYLKCFFNTIPIFKVGTMVILNDKRRGIVIKNNKGDMISPIIRINNNDIDLRREPDLYIAS